MADYLDLDELLEAPYKKDEDKHIEENGRGSGSPKSAPDEGNIKESRKRPGRRSKSRSRGKDKKNRSRSRSRDKKRSRSRDRKRSRTPDKKSSRSLEPKKEKDVGSGKKLSRDRSASRDRNRSSRRSDRPKSRSRERVDRHVDKERRRSRSKGRQLPRRSKSRSRDRKSSIRSRSKDARRSRSRDRNSSKRSISRDKRSSRRSRSRGRDDDKQTLDRSMSTDRGPRPRRESSPELTPEERDSRTVFVWQLAANIRQRDLEEFFSAVGKIRDVRLISDNKTRRSKGIAYVEFRDPASVPLALALTGTKLLGVPIQVQASQAEKNRVGQPVSAMSIHNPSKGPLRLYVGSLHYNITEEMLRGIFEPFGPLQDIRLIKDPHTNVSQGYGFLTYYHAEDARKALEQLNGFELAGRPMKVNTCNDRSQLMSNDESSVGVTLDNEDLDKRGLDLGASGRLALMAKLAEGTGLEVPKSKGSSTNATVQQNNSSSNANAASTQCFMLSNMFNPSEVPPDSSLYQDIREDVIEECSKHGGITHFYLDPVSPGGNVYAKCTSIQTAIQCVNALHGRYFSGRLITAAYVPLMHYHKLFPDSEYSTLVLNNI